MPASTHPDVVHRYKLYDYPRFIATLIASGGVPAYRACIRCVAVTTKEFTCKRPTPGACACVRSQRWPL